MADNMNGFARQLDWETIGKELHEDIREGVVFKPEIEVGKDMNGDLVYRCRWISGLYHTSRRGTPEKTFWARD